MSEERFLFSSNVRSSFRFLQLRRTEHLWIGFVFEGHIFVVKLHWVWFTYFLWMFFFLAKVLIEILFWQQKPKVNTGLCLLFLVLYDNNIFTSVSLQFMSSLFFIWQHATISWTQKYGEKGKRATVTGVQTLIDFQLQVLWAAAQKQAKREKKGPNTDKV